MDYQGNTRKQKELENKPVKSVQKVVTGSVVVQKKSLGRKFKDLFIEADFKSVMRYIAFDVLVPAAKNMMVEAATQGVRRMAYGETASRRMQYGHRTIYNTPVNRDAAYREQVQSQVTSILSSPHLRRGRYDREDYIYQTREEADGVLEQLCDIIENYEVTTVGDYKEASDVVPTPIDNKWGWTDLSRSRVLQVSNGFIVDLPPAEPIS